MDQTRSKYNHLLGCPGSGCKAMHVNNIAWSKMLLWNKISFKMWGEGKMNYFTCKYVFVIFCSNINNVYMDISQVSHCSMSLQILNYRNVKTFKYSKTSKHWNISLLHKNVNFKGASETYEVKISLICFANFRPCT